MGPGPDLADQGRTVDLSTVERHPPIVETAANVGAVSWRTEDDTRAFAARLAAHPAIANAFIELHGELGAGKTTFVRHLLRALGIQGRVKSPTYAVVEPHEAPVAEGRAQPLPVWHFDFFRFNNPQEWEDAGFRDIFASDGLKIAEWPEKAAGLLPIADLVMRIETLPDDARSVTLLAQSPVGRELLQ